MAAAVIYVGTFFKVHTILLFSRGVQKKTTNSLLGTCVRLWLSNRNTSERSFINLELFTDKKYHAQTSSAARTRFCLYSLSGLLYQVEKVRSIQAAVRHPLRLKNTLIKTRYLASSLSYW